jgi:hypothetical protein
MVLERGCLRQQLADKAAIEMVFSFNGNTEGRD